MPKIEEFPQFAKNITTQVITLSAGALAVGSESGADYMKQFIEANSPTGTRWHKKVNDARGNKAGARVATGTMLDAIEFTKPSANGQKIVTKFGWVTNHQDYFLDQDTGGYWHTAYGKPSGIGMGLLNSAQDGGGNGTLRVLGAYNKGVNDFIAEMKRLGFNASANSEEVF